MRLHGSKITVSELITYSREGYHLSRDCWGGSRVSSLWFAVTEPIIQMTREALCAMFGHYYRPEDSYCDVENGYEEHVCCRCGYAIAARF